MVAENKKINWRFYYFWKNKTKRQINSREMKKQKTNKQKSIGEQTRPIEIKGEGQRKLMVSSNNPNSDHQKWSHLWVVLGKWKWRDKGRRAEKDRKRGEGELSWKTGQRVGGVLLIKLVLSPTNQDQKTPVPRDIDKRGGDKPTDSAEGGRRSKGGIPWPGKSAGWWQQDGCGRVKVNCGGCWKI